VSKSSYKELTMHNQEKEFFDYTEKDVSNRMDEMENRILVIEELLIHAVDLLETSFKMSYMSSQHHTT